jgi:hypothetical protein
MKRDTRRNSVPQLLSAAAALYVEKNRVYGENYRHFGEVMLGLFPDGLPATKDAADVDRLGVLLNVVTCLQRYCYAPKGHADSARDLVVYAAMLLELTE